MHQKAVIAIGLMILVVTAGVSGYMLYSRSTGGESLAINAANKSETTESQLNIEPTPPVEVTDNDISKDMAVDYKEETPSSSADSSSQPKPQPKDTNQASDDRKTKSSPDRGRDDVEQSTRKRANDAINRILSKARSHKPRSGQNCKSLKTPAIHRASGVRHTFSYDCLPKGWMPVSDRSGPGR